MIAIYTTADEVFYCASYSFDTEGVRLDGTGVTLLVCKPNNGPDRGKLTKFPLQVIARIVDRS